MTDSLASQRLEDYRNAYRAAWSGQYDDWASHTLDSIGDAELRIEDLRQVLQQLADANRRADRYIDAFERLAAAVGQLDFDRSESGLPQTEEQWIEFVRGIDDRAQEIIEQMEEQ